MTFFQSMYWLEIACQNEIAACNSKEDIKLILRCKRDIAKKIKMIFDIEHTEIDSKVYLEMEHFYDNAQRIKIDHHLKK